MFPSLYAFVKWWLILTVLGWLFFPLTASVFRYSPGKGYAYARAFALVVLSYSYWLLGMGHILPNSDSALWVVVAGLASLALFFWWRQRRALGRFLRSEWRYLLVVEGLFFLTTALYAVYKVHQPAIRHTEQPMDFAFLNAILRSPRVPPNDPWLSGFSISYYYFGYLTVALVTRLCGVLSGMAYNLGLIHTLALTAVGACGLLYDLLRDDEAENRPALAYAVAGGLALVLIGNMEGLLELCRALGLGSQGFYRWIGVPGLADAPVTGTWLPEGNWWWRASRVIADVNAFGKPSTVITEFPAFSFILGDLHPHVMALPYVVLALALARELYLAGRDGLPEGWWRRPRWAIMPLLLGALGFLNSWDLPTFLGVALGAFALGRWRGRIAWRSWLRACISLALYLGLGSVFLYMPFYWGLQSQAGGIGLAYYAKTPLKQYLLCFGPWLLPLVADVGAATFVGRPLANRWKRALALWGILLLAPWVLTLLLGGLGRTLLGLVVLIRTGPWLLLFQSVMLTLILLDLGGAVSHPLAERRGDHLLARLMAIVGMGLTYAVEFFYLRDIFNTRMNTVFKFYYQAWMLLGIGAVFSAYRLAREVRWRRRAFILSVLLLGLCLYYPGAAAYTRGRSHTGEPTLDGTAFLRREAPAEYGAYLWLRERGRGGDVIVEGPGEEYVPQSNRLSAWTGVPTPLGWPGHELQWRGDDTVIRARLPDVESVYTSDDQEAILDLLHRYSATYLYIGPYEREKFGLQDEDIAFYDAFLEPAYAAEGVRLYRVP
ncbi:MAG: DUF2298 domain-containing protein [Chloroflexota bacterium]|nr:DUF2298 domain-containing protein [Chloroflexota bacterium]